VEAILRAILENDTALLKMLIRLEPVLGERKIRNYQVEQPDASAWRLILLAAQR